MKRIISVKRLAASLTAVLLWTAAAAGAVEVWVSPQGADTGSGSRDAPLATLRMGLYKARELRRLAAVGGAKSADIAGGIRIILRGGTYWLDEPAFIRPEDSGTAESPTIIEAAQGEKPTLSGGIALGRWKPAGKAPGLPKAAQGKVWVTDAPTAGGRAVDFRQLWVNGKKAIRARSVSSIADMQHILKVDRQAEELWIPTPKLQNFGHPAPLELFIHQMWEVAILRVKSMTAKGDSTVVRFYQPESRLQFLHPWPPAVIQHDSLGGNSTFFLANALELLDTPGEWFYDARAGKVFYYPRAGEDMSAAQAVAPCLDVILRVEGTLDRPVSHVQIKGVGFEHATWLRPSQMGHVPLQAGMYLIDAYRLQPQGTPEKPSLENQAWTGRMAGGVTVRNASNILFFRCKFERMAAAGLDYVEGTRYNTVEGCIFRDIGGSAIQVGSFSDEALEDHLALNPADERTLCRDERIANNLIEDCANEDWGAVGIAAGFVRSVTIEHNEVRDVSYSGISVGWGWSKAISAMRSNRIHANHVHRYAKYMYDVSAIYTLSAQPGTSITENYVHDIYSPAYVHDRHHWFYLYTDEGSSYITVKDNWCPSEKFLKNANGPGNTWENNGPEVSEEIVKRAGLQEEFREILNFEF
ncbi:MAG: right-handed parallel beta-helix repeat-containing protein [Prevotellaceae bacterium]|nr:right-handed parallel beta-helix repeat-containing protein [Prevotellaceae bacterium]